MSEPYSKYKTSGYLVLNLFKSYFKTSLSADELAKKISSSPYIIGLLGYYYELSLGDADKLDDAMKSLAFRSSDIPNADSFYSAMKAEADSNFTYIVKYAARESTKEIIETVETYGEVSKFIVKAAPFVLLGFVGLYVYNLSKKV